MKFQIISVRDNVANIFGTPNFVQSKGSAIRAFSDEVNRPDENNAFYKHPSDFELFFLGTYDDEQAIFELLARPESLSTAAQLVIKG